MSNAHHYHFCDSDFSYVPKEEKRRLAALDAELSDAKDGKSTAGEYDQPGIQSTLTPALN